LPRLIVNPSGATSTAGEPPPLLAPVLSGGGDSGSQAGGSSGGRDKAGRSNGGGPGAGEEVVMVGSNGWTRRVCDGLGGLFLFFLKFFYLIYRGGQPTTSENTIFTMTLVPRRLVCPPR